MDSKNVLITGANTGIGLALAKQIAAQGHQVILACRDKSKAQQAMAEIKATQPQAQLVFQPLDLSTLDSIKKCGQQLSEALNHLDVLINNAGIFPSQPSLTEDQFEIQLGVNYLGPFALTHQLLPLLKKSASARIIHVSSIMHYLGNIQATYLQQGTDHPYKATKAYANSKLANALFNSELAQRLPSNITSNAVHPGGVDSDIYRDKPNWLYRLIKPFLISTEKSAAYIANMALAESWQMKNGKFVSAHGPMPKAKILKQKQTVSEFYERSGELLGMGQSLLKS